MDDKEIFLNFVLGGDVEGAYEFLEKIDYTLDENENHLFMCLYLSIRRYILCIDKELKDNHYTIISMICTKGWFDIDKFYQHGENKTGEKIQKMARQIVSQVISENRDNIINNILN